MAKFRHHKYQWTKPFNFPRHTWSVVGPMGAVHYHVTLTEGYGPSAGLEFHHTRSTGYRCDEAPDHLKCEFTGEPCWHDGTSLYASETLWPQIQSCLYSGNHEAVFALLEWEYDRRFNDFLLAPSSSTGEAA